jgi:hypothetical protein
MPTVKMFGQQVDRKWVILAGAGGVGFVAFRWWTQRTSDGVATSDDFGVTQYTPPGQVPVTQSASGDYSGITGDEVPTTNAQWGTLAAQRLADMGFDVTTVSLAVGKYLSRVKLTLAESDIIRTVIGQLGGPPQNGPWPITIGAGTKPGTVPGATKVTWESHHVNPSTIRDLAKRYAGNPNNATSVESTLRALVNKNPWLKGRAKIDKPAIMWIPVRRAA